MCSHAEHCFLQRTQMKTAATWVVGLVTTAGYHMHTHPWKFWYRLSSLLPWFMTVRRNLLCTLDNAATAQVYSHWIDLKSWTMWFLSLVCFCSLFWPESLYLVPELNKQREKKSPEVFLGLAELIEFLSLMNEALGSMTASCKTGCDGAF